MCKPYLNLKGLGNSIWLGVVENRLQNWSLTAIIQIFNILTAKVSYSYYLFTTIPKRI